jgi:hypothetical protein
MEKYIDLTGQRFGKLTVLRKSDEVSRSGTLWVCSCDCGGTSIVIGQNLRKGRTKSCGCNRTPADLAGQTFGNLTVIEPVVVKGGHRKWLCRCICGSLTEVATSSLLKGTTKSCGCLRHQPSPRIANLAGKRFGRLLVLERAEDGQDGGIFWKCRCACGKETIVKRNNLVSGNTRSCGCLSLELAIQYGKLNVVHGSAFLKLYSEYQRNAEKGGRTFLLDTDLFRQLTTSSCHYCGAPPSRVKKRSDESYVYNGVNSIGSIGNVELIKEYTLLGKTGHDEFDVYITRTLDSFLFKYVTNGLFRTDGGEEMFHQYIIYNDNNFDVRFVNNPGWTGIWNVNANAWAPWSPDVNNPVITTVDGVVTITQTVKYAYFATLGGNCEITATTDISFAAEETSPFYHESDVYTITAEDLNTGFLAGKTGFVEGDYTIKAEDVIIGGAFYSLTREMTTVKMTNVNNEIVESIVVEGK